MMDRKKRLFNRILLVCGGSALLLFAGYVIFTKRPPKHFYIPEGYEGWVTVKYESEGAPALPEEDGTLIFRIPESGVLETSSAFEDGWARDEYFWLRADGSTEMIPREVGEGDEAKRFIHDRTKGPRSYDHIVRKLPSEIDTVLWDGTKISKRGKRTELQPGRDILEHFYVTPDPTPYFFRHDTIPYENHAWD